MLFAAHETDGRFHMPHVKAHSVDSVAFEINYLTNFAD